MVCLYKVKRVNRYFSNRTKWSVSNLIHCLRFVPVYIIIKIVTILHVKPALTTNSNQSTKLKMQINTKRHVTPSWKVGYYLVSNNKISYTVIHV